jgi:hypothetical protein
MMPTVTSRPRNRSMALICAGVAPLSLTRDLIDSPSVPRLRDFGEVARGFRE